MENLKKIIDKLGIKFSESLNEAFDKERLTETFEKYLYKQVETEEKIIKISNKMQKTELSTAKVDSLYKKSDELKKQLKSAYFSTQELIINSYFTNSLKTLITSDDVDIFRKKLYSFVYVIAFWYKDFRKNHSYIIYE